MNNLLPLLPVYAKIKCLVSKINTVADDIVEDLNWSMVFYALLFCFGILASFLYSHCHYYHSLVLSSVLLIARVTLSIHRQFFNLLINLIISFSIGSSIASYRILTNKNCSSTVYHYTKNAQVTGTVISIKSTKNESKLITLQNSLVNDRRIDKLTIYCKGKCNNITIGNQIRFVGDISPSKTSTYVSNIPIEAARLSIPPVRGIVKKSFNILNRNSNAHTGSMPIAQETQNIIYKTRKYIRNRIKSSAGSRNGRGMIAALTIGDSTMLPYYALENMRKAGLSHILAISGLHLTIIGIGLFMTIRSLMVRFSDTHLFLDIKKIAAVFAIIIDLLYLLLANTPVSAVRSFYSFGMLMIGILLNSKTMPLRIWSFACISILTFAPEKIFTASFQMSFMATFALIAGFARIKHITFTKGHSNKLISYICATITSSTFATIPLAFIEIYHFGYLSLSGLLSNIIAIPVVEFIVLPISFCGLIFTGTGIDKFIYFIISYLANSILLISQVFAKLPFSQIALSHIPGKCILLLIVGIICIFHKSRTLHYFGYGLSLLALLLWYNQRMPSLVIDRTHRVLVYKIGNNYYSLCRNGKIFQNRIEKQLGRRITFGTGMEKNSHTGESILCSTLEQNMHRDNQIVVEKNKNREPKRIGKYYRRSSYLMHHKVSKNNLYCIYTNKAGHISNIVFPECINSNNGKFSPAALNNNSKMNTAHTGLFDSRNANLSNLSNEKNENIKPCSTNLSSKEPTICSSANHNLSNNELDIIKIRTKTICDASEMK